MKLAVFDVQVGAHLIDLLDADRHEDSFEFLVLSFELWKRRRQRFEIKDLRFERFGAGKGS